MADNPAVSIIGILSHSPGVISGIKDAIKDGSSASDKVAAVGNALSTIDAFVEAAGRSLKGLGATGVIAGLGAGAYDAKLQLKEQGYIDNNTMNNLATGLVGGLALFSSGPVFALGVVAAGGLATAGLLAPDPKGSSTYDMLKSWISSDTNIPTFNLDDIDITSNDLTEGPVGVLFYDPDKDFFDGTWEQYAQGELADWIADHVDNAKGGSVLIKDKTLAGLAKEIADSSPSEAFTFLEGSDWGASDTIEEY